MVETEGREWYEYEVDMETVVRTEAAGFAVDGYAHSARRDQRLGRRRDGDSSTGRRGFLQSYRHEHRTNRPTGGSLLGSADDSGKGPRRGCTDREQARGIPAPGKSRAGK